MGVPALFTPPYRPVTVEIPLYGKLALAPKPDAPLLMVFGGIDVLERELDPADKLQPNKPVESGDYMWRYLNNLRSRFHIFVANNAKVNGSLAYRYVLFYLQWRGSPPAVCPVQEPQPFSGPYQVLYLFSGGYRPGMDLLKHYSARLFSTICLVDIWMGRSDVGSFYLSLAAANPGKMFYIHTVFGANNESAMNSIARKLGRARSTLVSGKPGESGTQTHLRTNELAVVRI